MGSRVMRASVVKRGLNCPVACGTFLVQGLRPCPLNWQADSGMLFLRSYLIDSRKTLVFMIKQVSLQWEVLSAHNADTQCSQGRKEARGQRKFRLNFPSLAIKYEFYFTPRSIGVYCWVNMVIWCLTFKEITNLFSRVATPFYKWKQKH